MNIIKAIKHQNTLWYFKDLLKKTKTMSHMHLGLQSLQNSYSVLEIHQALDNSC